MEAHIGVESLPKPFTCNSNHHLEKVNSYTNCVHVRVPSNYIKTKGKYVIFC